MEKYKVEIKWSLLFILAYFVWLYLEKYLGYHNEKALQEPIFNLAFTPFVFIIFLLALREKKKSIFNNSISWKEGFASGLVLSLLATITSTFAMFIFYNAISPDFFETAISLSKNKELALQNYNLPIFVKNNIFDKLSFGVVFSALISYLIKTK